jgi:8-hydroxy-5-deazaflavin:NADPH oxidoreductase
MKVAVLGSGVVGRTLAAKISALGHSAALGTRDPRATLARGDTGPMTPQTFAEWHSANPKVVVATFAEAAASAELVFNATNGHAAIDALESAGAGNLSGKTVIDTSNALDFSAGFPSLFVSNTDSLAERIQSSFPDALIVKSLNTVTAPVMVDPAGIAGGEHDLFVCGNDAAAKEQAIGVLRDWFGWKHVTDLGDITAARGLEMYLPLWLRLMGAVGTNLFNIRIAR